MKYICPDKLFEKLIFLYTDLLFSYKIMLAGTAHMASHLRGPGNLLVKNRFYSYRSASAGFLRAAFKPGQMADKTDISKAISPVKTKIHQLTGV